MELTHQLVQIVDGCIKVQNLTLITTEHHLISKACCYYVNKEPDFKIILAKPVKPLPKILRRR